VVRKANLLGREVIVAVKAYFDSSGDNASPCWTLAGVAFEESVSAGFEVDWKKALDSREPIAPYLHMKELCAGSGAFADEFGWNDAKRQSLLNDCFFVAHRLHEEKYRAFVAVLEMEVYREMNGSKLPKPIRLLNYFSAEQSFKWFCTDLHRRELREMHYVFDQNEPFCGSFQARIVRKKKSSRMVNAWHMVKSVDSGDMREHAGLQLADMIAWANNRKVVASEEDKWWTLHKFTEAGIRATRAHLNRSALELIAVGCEDFPDYIQEQFG
jgi:hypothetical protein